MKLLVFLALVFAVFALSSAASIKEVGTAGDLDLAEQRHHHHHHHGRGDFGGYRGNYGGGFGGGFGGDYNRGYGGDYGGGRRFQEYGRGGNYY